MRSSLSPIVANLYMDKFEKNALETYPSNHPDGKGM
jgi:hypothetical protein